ncbi:MAG: transcription termination/antitermination protein NusA, partial [Cyanobacteria bacterium J06576_12]
EIKSIAREPGSRSKIAVVSYDESVDPIGACVGQRGVRVSTVMNELSGEKIDIIPWSPEPAEFVAASLSPARVLGINLDEESHTAHVQVADDQLSLAIGKAGQNVRLAAKLTGWRIDIKGITPATDESRDDFFDDGMGEGAVSLTHPKKEDKPDDAPAKEASETPAEEATETAPEESTSE